MAAQWRGGCVGAGYDAALKESGGSSKRRAAGGGQRAVGAGRGVAIGGRRVASGRRGVANAYTQNVGGQSVAQRRVDVLTSDYLMHHVYTFVTNL